MTAVVLSVSAAAGSRVKQGEQQQGKADVMNAVCSKLSLQPPRGGYAHGCAVGVWLHQAAGYK
jgi:hypothetical protein